MALVDRDDIEPGVMLLRLNRPERLNALTHQLVGQLHDHLDAARADDDVRVVILTGNGRGFCAGADLRGGHDSEPPPFTPRPGTIGVFQLAEFYSNIVLKMRTLPKPVIAAVNGPATGGGLAYVLGSDVRIAARSARFAVSFIKAGFSACDMGTGWLLPRIVGAGNAHELLLTGRTFDADEAYRIGLVVDVVDDGTVVEAALAKARQIMENSPFGVAMTKETMWSQLEIGSLHAAVDFENRTQVMTTTTLDSAEAMRSFAEKRRPNFRYE